MRVSLSASIGDHAKPIVAVSLTMEPAQARRLSRLLLSLNEATIDSIVGESAVNSSDRLSEDLHTLGRVITTAERLLFVR